VASHGMQMSPDQLDTYLGHIAMTLAMKSSLRGSRPGRRFWPSVTRLGFILTSGSTTTVT